MSRPGRYPVPHTPHRQARDARKRKRQKGGGSGADGHQVAPHPNPKPPPLSGRKPPPWMAQEGQGGLQPGRILLHYGGAGTFGPAQHTTAQHAKRSVHTKKRARGGVMQLELQGRDRRRDRVVSVGQLRGFPRHGHPPREPRLPPRACSPAGWLFGAPKSTFLTSNRPPEAISDRSLRGSQNGMSRLGCAALG